MRLLEFASWKCPAGRRFGWKICSMSMMWVIVKFVSPKTFRWQQEQKVLWFSYYCMLNFKINFQKLYYVTQCLISVQNVLAEEWRLPLCEGWTVYQKSKGRDILCLQLVGTVKYKENITWKLCYLILTLRIHSLCFGMLLIQ